MATGVAAVWLIQIVATAIVDPSIKPVRIRIETNRIYEGALPQVKILAFC
jgi:hypothetical protein